MKTIKLLAVLWDDANFNDDQSSSDGTLSRGFAVGHLVSENRRTIIIALERFFEDSDYRRLLTIPKACVISRSVIEFEIDERTGKVTAPTQGSVWRRK
jgi:hypothetical protein